jgi:hypothetical protein
LRVADINIPYLWYSTLFISHTIDPDFENERKDELH